MKVGRWEPSSKRCSSCGEINAELTLAMRTWTCPSCGSWHHRDINAAINIAALAA
ncbi:transposase [Enterobacter roggenkampii]|nr:transposase [Enterobacter roggenkampii]MCO4146511.1 transposase [Enterobacter roggenkampii]